MFLRIPLKLIFLSACAISLVGTLTVTSEDAPNVTEQSPAAEACIVSTASVELNTTLRSKFKSVSALLFCIGCVTLIPERVNVLPLLDVTATSPVPAPSLICAISTSVSKIRESVKVTLAFVTLGIPSDQLPAVDHNLSPVALLNVDTATSVFSVDSLPSEPITTVAPPISIWAS